MNDTYALQLIQELKNINRNLSQIADELHKIRIN